MKLGAFDYLTKPIKIEELMTKMAETFERKIAHDQKVRSASIKELLRFPGRKLGHDTEAEKVSERHPMSESGYARLRKLILATMILVPAIPFYIVMGIGYYSFTTSIENSTMASMKRIVEDHRQMIETFLRERKSDLEFVAESY